MQPNTPLPRRSFLKRAALAPALMAALPQLVAAANKPETRPQLPPEEATILFQGDSITDAGRDKGRYYPNDASGMGLGYVHHITTHLLGRYPERHYRFYNRGISGNKVFQLADRWADDCLQLRPDTLSILIGVNDYWHTLSHSYKGTAEVYENDYRALLKTTKESLPEVRLIIAEPFYVEGGSAIDGRWAEGLLPYRKAARQIAADFGAVFIPLHSIFEKALEQAPASYWCPDGVHPSLAGSYLMAAAWLEALGVK
ncbi:MAG: SGNH/GDSL hydrolase family protein [Phaeodactylibacter sp.]|nr:SGNH/GDSL hydrolase family protein [Phaeodactylibacter sp.]MCB9274917.1 SGNH/GDSL hydrolase family protein [Lewinellaceae bacterium]